MGVRNTEAHAEVKRLLGIPEDEPIFIFRARDPLTVPMLARYKNMRVQTIPEGADGADLPIEWMESLDARTEEFRTWQSENPTKLPD